MKKDWVIILLLFVISILLVVLGCVNGMPLIAKTILIGLGKLVMLIAGVNVGVLLAMRYESK